MQLVHTRMRLLTPPTIAFTGRRFTFQRRLVTLCAWLMLLPNCGPLPQISQTLAMTAHSRMVQNLCAKVLILPEFTQIRQTGAATASCASARAALRESR